MPKCCVKDCTYRNASLFSVPINLKNEWEIALNMNLNHNSRICATHFNPDDIITTWESGVGVSKYTICLKRPKLKSGAIPVKILKINEDLVFSNNRVYCVQHDHTYFKFENTPDSQSYEIQHVEVDNEVMTFFKLIFENVSSINIPSKWSFDINLNGDKKIISFYKLSLYGIHYSRSIEKQFVISEDSDIYCHLYGELFDMTNILSINELKTVEDLENMLSTFENLKVCPGLTNKGDFQKVKSTFSPDQYIETLERFRHAQCTKIASNELSGICNLCKKLYYSMRQKLLRLKYNKPVESYYSPRKQKRIKILQLTQKNIKKKNNRAIQEIRRLKNALSDVHLQMQNVSDTFLKESLANSGVSDIQGELIKDIFSAAKIKNSKGRRYSENWMMLCLLFQIRSPSGYKFLREQNVIPLPCVNTIRKHLLAIKIGCGFDINFFKLFKKKFSVKTEYQKKGILVLDEIFLRSSIAVNSRTLTYSGLEDFGDEVKEDCEEANKADHGLVLMWQSLAENFTQPIAVFASKGPVKGIDLAKLVIKAIMLLEDAGGHVVGLTSDGASTNRSMWKELGICPSIEGFKNHFENPFDNTRKVFVFADVPHLMKTIRNRLHTNKQLRIHLSKPYIKWSDFHDLFLNEGQSLLKVCPKLTKHHFELNNFSKMKVKYATQLFSSSVAVGIKFYREKGLKALQDSHESELFAITLNNMFDALNRRFSAEGIRKNSKDLQTLRTATTWLNDWEYNMSNGFINKNEFLTKATAEGLRISLESTIDLSNYLLNECNFIYVLTGKLNQDCLEKFFGIIRQVAGPNDHPATPTFLQLYRILSVYSLVKAPKTGNCSISTENIPVITLSDLKEIVKDPDNLPERIKKINILKEKIDKILEDGHYDCDDIFLDHDYADSTSFECIVYYLAGYIARRLIKHSKCEVCISNLKDYDNISRREGVLVNLKSRGFLTNPDQNLFNILKLLESCFVKHASSQNVFEDTFEEFFKINNLKLIFPCPDHKSRVMSDLFTYYITMRMRQYTYIINQENKKNNRSKKKLSKLTND